MKVLHYCCLVKRGRTLKVAWQFAVRGLVAYKPVAYKKNVSVFCTESLVLETVYSETLSDDISFDKYLARCYVAVSILEIIGQIGNFSTLSSSEIL